VAIDRGFSAAELKSDAYRRYHDRLVQLGNMWEASVPGARSFVKSGMLAHKFKGESASEVMRIVKEQR